jgi:excisionase family DNA binding protein
LEESLRKEVRAVSDRLTCTVEEAARLLGISRTLAYRLVQSGQLPSFKVGKRRLVPVAAVETFIADQLSSTSAS